AAAATVIPGPVRERKRPADSGALKVLQTERLVLRRLRVRDAAFIRDLVNEPSWLKYIGDKGVRTLEDARQYLRNGPVAMYARLGFGLYRVELREGGEPIGICGLIRRDSLPDVDLGFALLPCHWRRGYAHEAAVATMAYGKNALGLSRLLAIVSPENLPSCRLLEKLGFRVERLVARHADKKELKLYATTL